MNNMSVLVAEDDLNLQVQLVEYLEIYFQNVYKSNDGLDAYTQYKKVRPDLLITDINMPKINGLDLIEKIRKEDESLCIIILTAHIDTEFLIKATELNLITYLVKPIQSEKLKNSILKVIKKIKENNMISLIDDFLWDKNEKLLYKKDEKISLTHYETSFLESLINNLNHCVTYEQLHYLIYENEEFSLNSLTSLVKRIRKKTTKEMITSCFKQGYKISTK